MKIKDLLNAIKMCEGGIIHIVRDYEQSNIDFLHLIQHELKKEYNVITIEGERFKNRLELLEFITPKSAIFVEYNKDMDLRGLKIGNNILVVSRFSFEGYVYGVSSAHIMYCSSIVVQLHKNKLKIVKSRYANLLEKKINIPLLLRKIKLEKLKNINLDTKVDILQENFSYFNKT